VSEVFRHDNNAAPQPPAPTDRRLIQLDKTKVKNSYANTCPVASTKEEIVPNCEVNQSCDPGQPDSQVRLANRLILSPFEAKRMAMFFKQGTVNLREE